MIFDIEVDFVGVNDPKIKNKIFTRINGDSQKEIEDYYLGNIFDFGDTEEHPQDLPMKATKVTFL